MISGHTQKHLHITDTKAIKDLWPTQKHLHITETKGINDHWSHTKTFNISQRPKALMITGHTQKHLTYNRYQTH